MDFGIESRQKDISKKYQKHELDIAYEFAKETKKELKELLRALILFGSTARKINPNDKTNDIDILIIVDDVSIQLSPELVQTYRIILEKIVAKVSKKLHVTTLRFTNFWEYVRAGDPIAINILIIFPHLTLRAQRLAP